MGSIHPTAVLRGQVHVDPTAEVGPWCVLDGDITVGARTRLEVGVSLQGKVTLGEDNFIGAHSVIGGRPHDPAWRGEPGEVVMGRGNQIFSFVTIDRGTPRGDSRTVLGDDNFVMAYTHLAHDCVLGNGCRITSYCGIAGLCRLHDHVVIAGMVGMQQAVRVGAHAFISGMSAVTNDILPFAIAHGTDQPTALRGANVIGMKRHGFSREDIDIARALIARFEGQAMPFAQILADIETAYDPAHPVVRRVLDFARAPSRSGVLR